MFFKHIVLSVLVMASLALTPAHAADIEDPYLPYLFAEESVFVCADDSVFDRLLAQESVDEFGGLCRSHEVVGEPVFLGWHFVTQPNYDVPNSEFIVARKYKMETDIGPVWFVWSPLQNPLGEVSEIEEDLHDELMMDYDLSSPEELATMPPDEDLFPDDPLRAFYL